MISMNILESLQFGFEPHKRQTTTFLWECKQIQFFGAGQAHPPPLLLRRDVESGMSSENILIPAFPC